MPFITYGFKWVLLSFVIFVALVFLISALGKGIPSAEIAYVRERAANWEIYAIEVDRHLRVNLSRSRAADSAPTWSPDGRYLAFVSDRAGSEDIFVWDTESGALRNLSEHKARDWLPGWSPDGTHLAFVSRRNGNDDVFIVKVDGSGLVNVSNHDEIDSYPAWSPDGRRLAFQSTRCCGLPIFIYDVSTAELSQPTIQKVGGEHPIWSPDGERLLFLLERPGNDPGYRLYHYADIGEIILGGRQAQFMMDSGGNEAALTWSPDGTQLAFASCYPRGCASIVIASADGQNMRELAYACDRSGWVDTNNPSWSPDSQRIAFVSTCAGNFDVYVINVDGTNLRRVTDDETAELFPVWRP